MNNLSSLAKYLIISISIVLIGTYLYNKNRTKKGAVISLISISLTWMIIASLANRFILIPAYIELMFGGQEEVFVSLLKAIANSPLYHNCITFKSVLQSKTLWLTQIVKSNDTEEVVRTFDIIWNKIKEEVKTEETQTSRTIPKPKEINDFLKWSKSNVVYSVYVFSTLYFYVAI